MNEPDIIHIDCLYQGIRTILSTAREQAYRAVNTTMVQSYWQIGKRIVEEEQQGAARAQYGTMLLKGLSERLTQEFGKGFDERELRKIRQFYLLFENRDTLRPELTWSHYRRLLSVESEQARLWYMNEAALSAWSTRQLDRQIATCYYERLLASRDKAPVEAEAIVKYSLIADNKQVFASKYKLYLPTEEELKQMLNNLNERREKYGYE